MQAILLAAGQSERLAPIKDKNLLPFCGKPLIEHQVAAIKAARIRDIVVVANPANAATIRRALKKYNNVVVVEQQADAGIMAAGVLAGARKVTQKGVLILSTNDIVEQGAFELIKEALKVKEADGVLLAKKVTSYFPGGYVRLDKKGFIERVVEKPGEGKEPSDLVNLVVHAYKDFPAFVKILQDQKGKPDSRYEEAVTAYIKKGARMTAAVYEGFWQPIKFPWHILRAMEHFLGLQKSTIDKTAQVSKKATLRGGPIHIGRGARVFDNAVVVGPAYVGNGVIVGNNALVRDSMVGDHSVVGFCTEIARSYLRSEVWTHSNYIGDSVIDHNVSFGAGGVIGNLRLDDGEVKSMIKNRQTGTGLTKFGAAIGEGCRFGINASLMPGIKVGEGSFVCGGLSIGQDIPARSFVRSKTNALVITKNRHIPTLDTRAAAREKLCG